MRQVTIKKQFDIPLSDQRLAEIAREMADSLEKMQNLQDELAGAKEAAKEIPALMKHVRELGTFIKEGAESKMIDCRIEYDDPTPGVKSIYRSDTGDLVDTLEMTGEELQGELSIGESGTLAFPPPPEPDPDQSPEA